MMTKAIAILESRSRPEQAADRLIIALDVATVKEAKGLVRLLGDRVSFYKIGLHLQLAKGLFGFAERLIRENKKVFLDFKYIDIEDTIVGAIDGASRMGMNFVTVYQSSHAIKAALKGRDKRDRPKILTVTLLTDRDQNYIRTEFNSPLSVEDFVVERARIIHEAGGDGVIASPLEVFAIRKAIPDPDFLIVTPGIRPSWSQASGHKRAGTPSAAIECGADYLVVGRPIIQAGARAAEAASRIIDEMQTAFDKRP
jgi:orotidine-5'-phosphate decarboxylase